MALTLLRIRLIQRCKTEQIQRHGGDHRAGEAHEHRRQYARHRLTPECKRPVSTVLTDDDGQCDVDAGTMSTFQGSSSPIRLIGCPAMRSRT
jgi:hypothetical protein